MNASSNFILGYLFGFVFSFVVIFLYKQLQLYVDNAGKETSKSPTHARSEPTNSSLEPTSEEMHKSFRLSSKCSSPVASAHFSLPSPPLNPIGHLPSRLPINLTTHYVHSSDPITQVMENEGSSSSLSPQLKPIGPLPYVLSFDPTTHDMDIEEGISHPVEQVQLHSFPKQRRWPGIARPIPEPQKNEECISNKDMTSFFEEYGNRY